MAVRSEEEKRSRPIVGETMQKKLETRSRQMRKTQSLTSKMKAVFENIVQTEIGSGLNRVAGMSSPNPTQVLSD